MFRKKSTETMTVVIRQSILVIPNPPHCPDFTANWEKEMFIKRRHCSCHSSRSDASRLASGTAEGHCGSSPNSVLSNTFWNTPKACGQWHAVSQNSSSADTEPRSAAAVEYTVGSGHRLHPERNFTGIDAQTGTTYIGAKQCQEEKLVQRGFSPYTQIETI